MKILIVTANFPSHAGTLNGGTAGVAWYLCQALQRRTEVWLKIVRPFCPVSGKARQKTDGLEVTSLGRTPCVHPAIDVFSRARVLRLAAEWGADVIHTQALPGWAHRAGGRGVATLHGILELDALYKRGAVQARMRSAMLGWIERRARRAARNIIAISPYTRQFLGPTEGKRIWDIANPVAGEFFAIQRSPLRRRLFSASHCTPLKNIQTLIRSFAPVARVHPDAELRLAGSDQDGPYGRECRKLCDALGVAAQVRFLGLLTIQQVQSELSQASCFVLVSRQENAPLSVSEAMAAGVPVLASRVGGLPWMVAPGRTGWLVDALDERSITDALMDAVQEEDLGRMGREAQAVALARHHPDRVAEQTVAVYRELMGNCP